MNREGWEMEFADRRSAADGHILIGGTGRAGTTLLVQYFTALGFDTGFTLERALGGVDEISKAGLEHPVGKYLAQGRQMAYVAKSPNFGTNLREYLDSGDLRIKHCIIPVRELSQAAESRRHVTRTAVASGKSPDDKQRGGIIARRKDGGKRQELLLAAQFHRFLFEMLHHDIPVHFLKFPEFARGHQDLYAALEPIMLEHGVSREESDRAFGRVVDPDLIHDFTATPPEQ